jgi:cell division initiation protein
MDLSPNDIRSYEFPNQMRGYDKDEVDSLLDQVAAALEDSKQQNLKLSMEMESLQSQLASLKQFEDTIKSAAIDARRNADMTIATAKQEAEMITSKARSDAESLMATRAREVGEIENQITKLGLTKKSYLSKIRSMIQTHLDMIEEVDTGEIQNVQQSEDLQITQSRDVTTETRETVASQPSDEPVQTESADASIPESDDTDVAEELKDAIRSDSPESDKPIDPELAAALENYKKTAADEGTDSNTSPSPSPPPQGVVVETTARAEDVPEGFFAKEEDLHEDTATDKVRTAQADSATEHNSIDPDAEEGASPNPLAPDNLAEELDEVAAKFEEEMDKAEQD